MIGRPRSVSDEEVFAAVARVVAASGPGGLTFAALAAESGLSAPALAQRFGSKRGLLVAFAEQRTAGVAELFATARTRAPSPLDALVGACCALAGDARSRHAASNDLGLLPFDLADPEVRGHVVAHARAVRRHLRRLLDDAVAAGELVGVDTKSLTRTCWVAYNGALVTWAIDGTGSLRASVRSALEAALAPHRGRRSP